MKQKGWQAQRQEFLLQRSSLSQERVQRALDQGIVGLACLLRSGHSHSGIWFPSILPAGACQLHLREPVPWGSLCCGGGFIRITAAALGLSQS